jgi:ATP-dependent Clp protease ATP-binding subunit ClpA
MSDTTNTDAEGGTESKPSEYHAPASQADLDRIIADRVSRERAKYGDYDDLKTKAAEYDKAAEAQKSELQKTIERAEAAEKKAKGYEAEKQIAAWRAEVAKATGVPAAALRGSTKEELTAHAETLKPLITHDNDTGTGGRRGALGPYVPSEGTAPGGAAPRDFLRESLKH